MKATKQRTMRLVRRPTPQQDGLLLIKDGSREDFYDLHQVRCEAGVACEFRKQMDGSPVYTVAVHDRLSMCDCMSWRYRGTCRHVEALRVLVRAEKVFPLPLEGKAAS